MILQESVVCEVTLYIRKLTYLKTLSPPQKNYKTVVVKWSYRNQWY